MDESKNTTLNNNDNNWSVEYKNWEIDGREENKQLKDELKNSSLEIDKLKTQLEEISEKYKQSEESLLTLRAEKDYGNNPLKEFKDNLDKILAENETLKDEVSKSSKNSDDYETIRDENNELKKSLETLSQKYDQLSSRIKYDELEQNLAQSSTNNEMKDSKDSELRHLQIKNEEYSREIKLKKEASQYQSALGSATNFRINDDDRNHHVQLKNDISELQNKLRNYVTTLKGDFEIKFDAINNLIKKYDIKTSVTPENPKKSLIRAVLQHHILKKIIKDMNKYFNQNSETESALHLEAEIISKSKDLEDKLAEFSKTRCGSDQTTHATSIKIRQKVNIALSNRGFSDIISDGKDISQEHVFINLHKNKLNSEMNKYRIIKDDKKRKSVEKLAPDIIREFVRLIQFRLKIQEPSAQIKWIPINSDVDSSIMEGNWDKDDIDNLVVEVCSFPVIGQDLDDVENRKVYTPAQVFTKSKSYKSYVISMSSKVAKRISNLSNTTNSGPESGNRLIMYPYVS
uniref:Uncharacterized protein n=1 Tax=Rhizophagus irregularis (strain DAOM 181602 / DAOM 197198 / MUCL 43194) TaxID=747089 RepID=U9TQT9_RHIID